MSEDQPEVVYLTPGVVVYEPPFNQTDDGLIVPNPIAGEPRPVTSIGITIPIRTEVDDEVLMVNHAVQIEVGDDMDERTRARIIPDSRIVETDHPAVINMLQSHGYVQCDPPESEAARVKQRAVAQKKAEDAAVKEAAKAAEEAAKAAETTDPAASGQEA